MKQEIRRAEFLDGVKAGLPIALAYLAVGISVGLAARNVGMNAFQGFLLSIMNLASAGEYAEMTVIAAGGTLAELVLMVLVVNARYLLMGAALAQWAPPRMKAIHRIFIPYAVTDEIFAVSIGRIGYMSPWFNYGAVAIAAPAWAIGTAIGVIVGNALSPMLLAAMSIALFGMFINVVVGPAKREKAVFICVVASFAVSFLFSKWPLISGLPDSIRILIITVLIGAFAAWRFPVEPQNHGIPEEGAKA